MPYRRLYHDAPSAPESFLAELAAYAPRNDQIAWLHASWRPDWERWCIWQMLPPVGVPATVWGPDTRLTLRVEQRLGGRMIRMAPDERFRLILNPALMTRWAWRLHLETGCYPQPLWVVEGRHGGHKWSWSEQESRRSVMRGGPEEAPEPGSLEYAPLDRRVLAKIVHLDRLRSWNLASKALNELDARDFEAREQATLQQLNRELWDWMDSQVDEAIAAAAAEGVRLAPGRNRVVDDADVDYEQIERDFIENHEEQAA